MLAPALFLPWDGLMSGLTAGLTSADLLSRSGEQSQQPKDDVADHPNTKDQACTYCTADRGTGPFCIGCQAFAQFADLDKVGDQPDQHQDVECHEKPFEDFAEEPAFRLSDRMAAVRAVKGFCRYVFAAARTTRQGSLFGHYVVPTQIQFSRESCALHGGQGQISRQGGTTVSQRGQRSPQQGRSLQSGAAIWDDVEGRCRGVSYEPRRHKLGDTAARA